MFGFRIFILSHGLGKKLSKITLNFDPIQHFRPYLKNGHVDIYKIFTAAYYQFKWIITKVWFSKHHFK